MGFGRPAPLAGAFIEPLLSTSSTDAFAGAESSDDLDVVHRIHTAFQEADPDSAGTVTWQALSEAMLPCFDGINGLLVPATTCPAPDAATTGDPAFN